MPYLPLSPASQGIECEFFHVLAGGTNNEYVHERCIASHSLPKVGHGGFFIFKLSGSIYSRISVEFPAQKEYIAILYFPPLSALAPNMPAYYIGWYDYVFALPKVIHLNVYHRNPVRRAACAGSLARRRNKLLLMLTFHSKLELHIGHTKLRRHTAYNWIWIGWLECDKQRHAYHQFRSRLLRLALAMNCQRLCILFLGFSNFPCTPRRRGRIRYWNGECGNIVCEKCRIDDAYYVETDDITLRFVPVFVALFQKQ